MQTTDDERDALELSCLLTFSATTADRMPSCEGCGAKPDRLDFDDSGGFLCASCSRAIAGGPTAADLVPIRLIGARLARAMADRLETKSE